MSITKSHTAAGQFLASPGYQNVRDQFLRELQKASQGVSGIKPPRQDEATKKLYAELLKSFQASRGRELFYPYVSSGLGSGPFVELMDGSVKLDMITGIGVHFFGRNHPELLKEQFEAMGSELIQGNLQPGHEAAELLEALLQRVGAKSRLKTGWISTCGTMANEIALKIIRQKKFPATKIIAFADCFAGRSTAMQEITDNPKYRDGQPTYGEVLYLPFYDPRAGLEASIQKTTERLKEYTARYPSQIAALMMELVQGEGGFRYAPREFYVAVFEGAKKAGLAIWIDEIQTFGRTGELFAYQTLGLDEYPDVVTVAKMLLSSVVLFAPEYNPRPGLVAGTFSGGSASLRASRRVLEMLDDGKYFGPTGKIQKLSTVFKDRLEELERGKLKGKLSDIRVLGGMIAFQPMQGTLDQVKKLIFKLFEQGLIVFYAGHDPYLVRMLPPFGAMEEKDAHLVCDMIEKGMLEVFS